MTPPAEDLDLCHAQDAGRRPQPPPKSNRRTTVADPVIEHEQGAVTAAVAAIGNLRLRLTVDEATRIALAVLDAAHEQEITEFTQGDER